MSKGKLDKERRLEYLIEVIDTLIGEATAVGAAHIDEDRQRNLETLGTVVNHLIERLYEIKRDNFDRHEHSRKANGQLANQYLEGISDYFYDYFYEWFVEEPKQEVIKWIKEQQGIVPELKEFIYKFFDISVDVILPRESKLPPINPVPSTLKND